MGTTEHNDLQIIIEAVNKASKELNQVQKDLVGLSKSATEAGSSATAGSKGIKGMIESVMSLSGTAKTAGSSVGGFVSTVMKMAPQIAIALVSIYAIIKAFQLLKRIVSESVQVYNEYEMAMRGLQSVSASFGQSQDEAKEAAMSLAQDGLISVSTAAVGLRNLMSAGLGLDKSIELMKAYKDEAAFGRALTLSYDQAVGNLSESFKTENSMIGNLSGQTENYNYIMDIGASMLGKTTAELTQAERVQAKYLGTLEVAKKATGDTTTYSDTYQGSLSKLRATLTELGIQIGSYFQPILKSLTDWFGRSAETAGSILVPALKGVAYIVQGLVGVIQIAIDTLISFGDVVVSIGKSIGSFSFEPLRDSLKRSGNRLSSDWEGMVAGMRDIGKGGIDNLNKDMQEMFDSSVNEASKTAQKLAEIAEEYAHSLEKVNKNYKSQLQDLVIRHRDAYKKLKQDIKDLEQEQKETLEEMKIEFEKSMEDMAESHAEKTKSILDDIEEEKKALQDEIEDISAEWNDLIALTMGAGEDRLANLQAQLDKELALGGSANQEKIDALQELIAKEEEALENAIGEQEDKRDDEISDVEETYNEKIRKLQEELDAELLEYQESVEEKKTEYQKDVDNYNEAMEEKIDALEDKLDEEKAIREKYAEDFKKIGDKQAEDDITRLKRKHEEELEEMAYQYEKKISELTKSKEAETEVIRENEEKQQQFIKKTNDVIEKKLNLISATPFALQSSYNQSPLSSYGASMPWEGKPWENLFGYQSGGLVTSPGIVGENNYPEVVLPLSEPQRMANILKSLGISGGGGDKVEQNFYITVQSQADVDMIMERAMFNAKYK